MKFRVLGISFLTLMCAAGRSVGQAPASAPAVMSIPVTGERDYRLPPPGLGVMLKNGDFWSIEKNQPTGVSLAAVPGFTAFSQDGKLLAVAQKSANQKDTAVFVYSVETAQKIAEIPGGPTRFTDGFTWGGGTYLFVTGRDRYGVEVWDAASGKLLQTIKDPAVKRDRAAAYAATRSGKYLALVGDGKLNVYESATGKSVATMRAPLIAKPESKLPRALPARPGAPARGVVPIDAKELFGGIKQLRFSPDARELLAYINEEGHHLVVWNTKGDVTAQLTWPYPMNWPDGTADWLPDGSGFFVDNRLIYDRESKHLLFGFSSAAYEAGSREFLDKDRLMVLNKDQRFDFRLETLTIPWPALKESLAAASNPKTEAYLKPGQSVSIEVDLHPLGQLTPAKKAAIDHFTKRFAAEGVTVKDNSPVTLTLKLHENPISVPEVNLRPPLLTTTDGELRKPIDERKGGFILTLTTRDGKRVLWQRSVSGMDTAKVAGRAAITGEQLAQELETALESNDYDSIVPWFYPVDPSLQPLPLIVKDWE